MGRFFGDKNKQICCNLEQFYINSAEHRPISMFHDGNIALFSYHCTSKECHYGFISTTAVTASQQP